MGYDLGCAEGRKGTSWMCAQYVTDSFCIVTDTFDAPDEVAAVAFKEDAVFGPVVVFVVGV
jgi:hypothetical protein